MIKSLLKNISRNAAKHSNIPNTWLNFIQEPKAIITVKFPLEKDNGDIETITATRIIHSNHHLPTKGGLRFSLETSHEDLEGLAFLMTLKSSLNDLPIGGAKGCVFINPKKYSFEERCRIARRYTIEMWKRSMINSSTDVMGPDTGTDESIMNVIQATYKNVICENDVNSNCVVTGKSLSMGGLVNTRYAAAYGVKTCAELLIKNLNHETFSGVNMNNTHKNSVIVAGFGTNSYNIATLLRNTKKFKIIGITDEEYGCFNIRGFNIEEINMYKQENNNSLRGISKIMNERSKILSQNCDILVVTKELSLTHQEAEKINCKVVIEASNVPLTNEAIEVLKRRNIPVIPDILSYSGGFICSYLDWLKQLEHKNLTLMFKRFETKARKTMINILASEQFGKEYKDNYEGIEESELVYLTMEEIIENSFKNVLDTSLNYNIDLRSAATKIALDRIYSKYNNGLHTNIL